MSNSLANSTPAAGANAWFVNGFSAITTGISAIGTTAMAWLQMAISGIMRDIQKGKAKSEQRQADFTLAKQQELAALLPQLAEKRGRAKEDLAIVDGQIAMHQAQERYRDPRRGYPTGTVEG